MILHLCAFFYLGEGRYSIPIDEDTIRLSDGCFFTAEIWAIVQESLYLVLVLLYTLFERRHEYIAISSISSYAQRWSARPHADGHHPCHIWVVLALQCLPPGQTQMETEEAGEPTPGLFGHFVYHYCERSATIGS